MRALPTELQPDEPRSWYGYRPAVLRIGVGLSAVLVFLACTAPPPTPDVQAAVATALTRDRAERASGREAWLRTGREFFAMEPTARALQAEVDRMIEKALRRGEA